jgi:hypothetical protein
MLQSDTRWQVHRSKQWMLIMVPGTPTILVDELHGAGFRQCVAATTLFGGAYFWVSVVGK